MDLLNCNKIHFVLLINILAEKNKKKIEEGIGSVKTARMGKLRTANLPLNYGKIGVN